MKRQVQPRDSRNAPLNRPFHLDSQRQYRYNDVVLSIFVAAAVQFYNLPMSLGHLNKQALCPKKDYSTNRLTTGQLQLSEGKHNVEVCLNQSCNGESYQL